MKSQKDVSLPPLTVEELKHHRTMIKLRTFLEGPSLGVEFDKRLLTELLTYRSMKRVNVVVDEHFSSAGTTTVLRIEGQSEDKSVLGSFPLVDAGFRDLKRGQRFAIFIMDLPPDTKMKPGKNPFLTKRKKRGAKAT